MSHVSQYGHFVIDCEISTAHCLSSSGDALHLLCLGLSVARTVVAGWCPITSNDHLVTNSPAQQANTIAWSYHTSCTQNEISNIFHHMHMQAQGFHGNDSFWYRVVTVFEKQQKQKTTP